MLWMLCVLRGKKQLLLLCYKELKKILMKEIYNQLKKKKKPLFGLPDSVNLNRAVNH